MLIKLGVTLLLCFSISLEAGEFTEKKITNMGVFDYISSGIDSFYKNFSKKNIRVNIKNKENFLFVKSFKFSSTHIKTVASTDSHGSEHKDVSVIGKALVYPNPFKQTPKTELGEEDAVLGYELSENGEIAIHIYNMQGIKIFKQSFAKGAIGGVKGYNNIYLTRLLEDVRLSTGVYVFYLVNNDKVLKKGKMAIKPS